MAEGSQINIDVVIAGLAKASRDVDEFRSKLQNLSKSTQGELGKEFTDISNAVSKAKFGIEAFGKTVNESLKTDKIISYSQQLSNLNKLLEENYQKYKSGSISLTEYNNKSKDYQLQVKKINSDLTEFNKTINKSSSALGGLMQRVYSHSTWIASGALIAGMLGIPMAIEDIMTKTEQLNNKIKQNLELSQQYVGNEEKLTGDLKQLQNVAALYSVAYGAKVEEVLNSMVILSRRFKDTDTITYLENLVLTIHKLDNVPLETASQNLEAVILQFGLNTQQTKDFVNQFSVAVHTARITGTELLDALQRSGSVFHQYGANTKEAIAAISALSTTTARTGATIGNTWKSILSSTEKDKVQKVFDDLGISMYDDEGKAKDLSIVFSDVMSKWKTFDQETRNKLGKDWAGQYQLNALASFFNDAFPIYQQLVEEMGKANDELTTKLLKTSLESYATKVEQLKASFQILGMTIGNELLPQLKSFVDHLTAGVMYINEHRQELANLITMIEDLGIALLAWRAKNMLLSTSMAKVVLDILATCNTKEEYITAMKLMGESTWTFAKNAIAATTAAMSRFFLLYAAIEVASEAYKQWSDKSGTYATQATAQTKFNSAQYGLQQLEANKGRMTEDEYKQARTNAGENIIQSANELNDANYRVQQLESNNFESSMNSYLEKAQKMAEAAEARSKLGEKGLPSGDTKLDSGGSKKGTGSTEPLDKTPSIISKEDQTQLKLILDAKKQKTTEYNAELERIKTIEEEYGVSKKTTSMRLKAMNDQEWQLGFTRDQLRNLAKKQIDSIDDLATMAGTTAIYPNDSEVDALIRKYANENGVNFNFAKAIAQAESGRSQDAVSSAGAIGVMQLMPDTAQGLGVNPNDMEQNIEGGIKYLAQMLQQFNGDMRLAAAGYNAGPQAVINAGGVPHYAETQGYVGKVMGNYNSYEDNPDIPLVSGLKDLVAPDEWKSMSKEAKVEFAEAHKEQTQDVNVVLATLKSASETNTKAAEMSKDIINTQYKRQKEIYDSITKIIAQEKSIAEQQATQEEYILGLGINAVQKDNIQLKQLNAEINAMEDGIKQLQKGTIEYDKLYNELLKLKMQRDKLKGIQIPGDTYKETQEDIDYRKKMSEASSPLNLSISQSGNKQAQEIEFQTEKVKALKTELDNMVKNNSGKIDTQAIKDVRVQYAEALKDLEKLQKSFQEKLKSAEYNVLDDLLLKGNSIKDIWKKLWSDLATDALKALMRINNESPSILSTFLGVGKPTKNTNSAKGIMTSDLSQWFGSSNNNQQTKGKYDISYENVMADAAAKTYSDLSSGADKKQPTFTFPKQDEKVNWWDLGKNIFKLFGHAEGGIFDEEHVAKLNEGNKKEAVIPMENASRGTPLWIETGKQMGLIGKSNGVVPDLKNPDLAKQSTVNVQLQQSQEHIAAIERSNQLLQTQNQMILEMLNNGTGNNGGVAQPIVMTNKMSDDELYNQMNRLKSNGYKF